jgi:TatA/E family protein of Tat protein translocase
MPGIGAGHWWIIAIVLVIVLIIWGPGKLPDVGSGLGRAIREFRKASSDTRDEFSKATRGDAEHTAGAPAAAPAAAAPLAQPAPVAGGPPAPAAAERAAEPGDHTTAV